MMWEPSYVPGGTEGSPLGNTHAEFPPPNLPMFSLFRRRLRDRAKAFQPFERQRCCGSALFTGSVAYVGSEKGRPRVIGPETCGSVWACPVCSARIRRERAAEIKAAVEHHGSEHVVMVTLTVRHEYGEAFKPMAKNIALAFRKLLGGRQWERLCETYGVEHYVRGVETTHGANGWHPHVHALFFLTHKPSDAEMKELEVQMGELWASRVARVFGASNVPSAEYGVRVTRCHDGTYLSKMGLEMTDPGTKEGRRGNRGPWQILEDATDGDKSSIAIWKEYVEGTRGHRALTWSKGAKKALGLGEEKSDEEIAKEEASVGNDEQETMRVVRGEVWRAACARHVEAPTLIYAALLLAGSEGAARLTYELAGLPYDEKAVEVRSCRREAG